MNICDTGSFFQKSFLKVIDPKEWKEPVVTAEEYERVETGKDSRSVAILDDDMRFYNRLENNILARVLHELDTGFRELGIHLGPAQWFGPGQAAQAWLEGKAPTTEELQEFVPRWFLEAARASYYGGWFEIMAHGLIPGIAHEYDINSAYPYIISRIPCLRHGKYTRGTGNPGVSPNELPATLCLVYANVRQAESSTVSGHQNNYIGTMLHRDNDGNISRPDQTEGWYWEHELQAAQRAGCISVIRYQQWIKYVPCNCPPPFASVQDIYNTRLRVGKTTPLGIACKLTPNSLYGKFAQSVGNPKFANAIYASLITSWCRTMILDSIATHPKGKSNVLMVATDGVYFREPHPGILCSSDLGSWEHKSKNNLCLFKPGVYWDDKARENIRSGEAPIFKARGVNARDFASQIETIDNLFQEMHDGRAVPGGHEWPSVEFGLNFSMVTATQALARGKWHTAGMLYQKAYDKAPTAKQSSNPIRKRSAWYWDQDILRSKPPINFPYEKSHPYEKRFGIEDPWSQESLEEFGISPDGLPSTLWNEVLYDV